MTLEDGPSLILKQSWLKELEDGLPFDVRALKDDKDPDAFLARNLVDPGLNGKTIAVNKVLWAQALLSLQATLPAARSLTRFPYDPIVIPWNVRLALHDNRALWTGRQLPRVCHDFRLSSSFLWGTFRSAAYSMDIERLSLKHQPSVPVQQLDNGRCFLNHTAGGFAMRRFVLATVSIASFALLAALIPMTAFAKPGHHRQSPPPEPVSLTIQGTLTSFEYSPKKGHLNGFYVDTGSGVIEVKFPHHEADNVTAVVSVGSLVEVSGDLHTGKEGDSHLQARTITNLDSGQSVTIGSTGPSAPSPGGPPPPTGGPPPPTQEPPPPPADAEITIIEGTLTGFEYSPKKGHLNGFWLDTASGMVEVRFPHHQADAVTAIVSVGASVRVSGEMHTGPKGDTHLKASTIENLDTGQSTTIY